MNPNDKKAKKERKADVKRLWKLLHTQDIDFSDSIEWLGKKALECTMHRNYITMFQTYLMVMIKVDNRLFLGCTYWDINSKRVAHVYRLLIVYGYAEKIIQLALGASNLYTQIKRKGYCKKADRLKDLAERYCIELEQHRQKYDGDSVNRKAGWDMIRVSNRVFAEIYDIVEDGILGDHRINTYCRSLQETSEYTQVVMDAYERLLEPRKYKIKKIFNKFRPKQRNKRKRIKLLEYEITKE